jgi:hypothetical protein
VNLCQLKAAYARLKFGRLRDEQDEARGFLFCTFANKGVNLSFISFSVAQVIRLIGFRCWELVSGSYYKLMD